MTKKEFLQKIFTENELTNEDWFKSNQYVIITRSGIEKIQYRNLILVDFETVRIEPDFAVIKAISSKSGSRIETFGSAKWSDYTIIKKKDKEGREFESKQLLKGNTNSWYVAEMAEKRALSRIILKVMGLYEHGVFSEVEGVHLNETDYDF